MGAGGRRHAGLPAGGLAVPEVLADDDGAHARHRGPGHDPGDGRGARPAHPAATTPTPPPAPASPRQLGTFLAGLHAIDPAEVPGLAPSDPLADYRAAYDQIDDASPTFEAAHRWLVENRPARRPDGRSSTATCASAT